MPRQNPRPDTSAEAIVARNVQWRREARGWSMAELASRMAAAGSPVNQTAIHKIEKGEPRRTISLNEALALAQAFGITVAELLTSPEATIYSDTERGLEEIRQITADAETFTARLAEPVSRLRRIPDEVQAFYKLGSMPAYLGRLCDLAEELQRAACQLSDISGTLISVLTRVPGDED
jgi:transcriptional regulator with XRE-family HTH domain